ncbi:MAG TPA: glucose-6-phosphate dehydrogenase (coenzyme-F420) [Steroidobacteraceae bacterium]|nr:glucose-6-phosphate dehydrogenase (coenzyme-F420) [Steroidobacteraceae bacterium]
MTIRLGYKASAEQFGPAELLDYSILAEQRGFDSVFVSDHFQPWRHSGGHAPFSLAWMGALGARTSRVLIGTSVLTPTFRYHPAVIAQAFATLGVLFPDRLILGVGTGEALNEVPATGLIWPEPKERTARLKEAVALIRQLWSESRVSFEGTFFRTRNATIYDKPERPVPIYVAAAGPLMAKYAGQAGDGFICTSGKPWTLYSETLLPNLEAGVRTSGRAAGSFERMIELKVSYDTDRQRALEDTRHWAALALSQEERNPLEDPLEMERVADALPAERTAQRWIVSSDPDEHLSKLEPYIELGFRHLVFHAPGTDQRRFLDLYSQHVLPRLRNKYG